MDWNTYREKQNLEFFDDSSISFRNLKAFKKSDPNEDYDMALPPMESFKEEIKDKHPSKINVDNILSKYLKNVPSQINATNKSSSFKFIDSKGSLISDKTQQFEQPKSSIMNLKIKEKTLNSTPSHIKNQIENSNQIFSNKRNVKNFKIVVDLISIGEIGLTTLFKFENFNKLQSICFETLWNSNKNMIVSAPTGSGKTVLFEIAIAKLFSLEDFNEVKTSKKAIYIAPIKTLCQQKYSEWKEKFTIFNLKLLELTGDTDVNDFSEFERSNIIVTTPEKWDSMTRKWKENNKLVSCVGLLLIDEVHLLNTEERGATLEAVVSRMKIISRSSELKGTDCNNLRMIAVSATIPNINDLAEWLEVDLECIKAFGDEYRATPIEKHVFGYHMPKNEFQFERSLNYKLVEIIRKFSSRKPTLIFCQTQKGTISACEQIVADINLKEFIKDESHYQKLLKSTRQLNDKNLQKFVIHGIGFHNAGMSYDDRHVIEDLFISGDLFIICTTSTLAMGVNLPARLVIIKSTLCYRGSGLGYSEYSPLEIEQMIGRAGRPQFDTHGIVVIMTEKKQINFYQRDSLEKNDLESHFFNQYIEHLNAEISLKTIKNLKMAIDYLKGTFCYIRMNKNPKRYGISPDVKSIEEKLHEMVKLSIQDLASFEMIQFDLKDSKITPLELGIDMSRYYVSFKSLKNFITNSSKQDLKSLILNLSESEEFEKFRSRLEERKILTSLNLQNKFQVEGSISNASKKAFVLIQAALSNLIFDSWELKRQTTDILSVSWRILHCFKRYYSLKKMSEGLENSIYLIKSISMRTWGDSDFSVLKQISGIGDKLATSLIENKLKNFGTILEANVHTIEKACNKNAPFGIQLQKKILAIPQIKISKHSIHHSELNLKIELFEPKSPALRDTYENKANYYLIISDCFSKVSFFKYLNIQDDWNSGLEIWTRLSGNYPISISLINEKYHGLDTKIKIGQDSTLPNNSESKSNPLSEVTPIKSERCTHKCKDKKKCKHQCCKSEFPIKMSKTENSEFKDDEIAFIDDILEQERNLNLNNDPSMLKTNPLKLKQSNISFYMTTNKKNDSKSHDSNKTVKRGQLEQNYCENLLNKFQLNPVNVSTEESIKSHLNFDKLFGDLFE